MVISSVSVSERTRKLWFFVDDHLVIFHGEHDAMISCGCLKPSSRCMLHKKMKYGYGSIPINTILSGMNIHKSQLFWCEQNGVQGFDTLPYVKPQRAVIFSRGSLCSKIQNHIGCRSGETPLKFWCSKIHWMLQKMGPSQQNFVTTSIMVYEKKGVTPPIVISSNTFLLVPLPIKKPFGVY